MVSTLLALLLPATTWQGYPVTCDLHWRLPGVVFHRFHDGVLAMEHCWKPGAAFPKERPRQAGERFVQTLNNARCLRIDKENGGISIYRQNGPD